MVLCLADKPTLRMDDIVATLGSNSMRFPLTEAAELWHKNSIRVVIGLNDSSLVNILNKKSEGSKRRYWYFPDNNTVNIGQFKVSLSPYISISCISSQSILRATTAWLSFRFKLQKTLNTTSSGCFMGMMTRSGSYRMSSSSWSLSITLCLTQSLTSSSGRMRWGPPSLPQDAFPATMKLN